MPSPPTMRAIKWICITDTSLPAGFAPFGIRDLGGLLFVAIASSSGAAVGLIDIFKENGTFVKRITHGAPLNQLLTRKPLYCTYCHCRNIWKEDEQKFLIVE